MEPEEARPPPPRLFSIVPLACILRSVNLSFSLFQGRNCERNYGSHRVINSSREDSREETREEGNNYFGVKFGVRTCSSKFYARVSQILAYLTTPSSIEFRFTFEKPEHSATRPVLIDHLISVGGSSRYYDSLIAVITANSFAENFSKYSLSRVFSVTRRILLPSRRRI